MPSEQIYFMYGFAVCFIFFIVILFIVCYAHKRELSFQCGMRRLEVDAVREHWKNQLELLAKMKGYSKYEIA